MSQSSTSDHTAWFRVALALMEASETFVLSTVAGPDDHPRLGEHFITKLNAPRTVPVTGISEGDWSAVLAQVFAHGIGRLELIRAGDTSLDFAMSYYGPPAEAWIFGAGHIAQALSPQLNYLGWRIVVCDDRAEFVTPERFPNAAELRAGSFVESARVCARRPDPWIILVTRGHQHDQAILTEFVQHRSADYNRGASYIGMIGSKRRVGTVRRQLTDQGFPASVLDTLHAPIGLPIGADTPGEIALSIAAEMVAVRRGLNWDHASASLRADRRRSNDSADAAGRLELWRRIAQTLDAGNPCVLATIVNRRGSTPRGVGAQMVVYGNGTAEGTIGGGCGEGEVLRAAREMLLGDGSARLLQVDLTGDQSSETTDVCGGRYTVFCELLK